MSATAGTEREITEVRVIVPRDPDTCTANLINNGITIDDEGVVTVEFGGTGAATGYNCNLDRRSNFRCEFNTDSEVCNKFAW